MIDNHSFSNLEKTVEFVLNGFLSNEFTPTIIEKNSNESFLFKYYKDNISFYFDFSPLVIETKIISERETIFHNFFYPFSEKTYIISSDSRIFNKKNTAIFNVWIAQHKFIK